MYTIHYFGKYTYIVHKYHLDAEHQGTTWTNRVRPCIGAKLQGINHQLLGSEIDMLCPFLSLYVVNKKALAIHIGFI